MCIELSNVIGIFGGSFSPLTKAHIAIAQAAIDELGLEKVVFLPVGDVYVKEGLMPSSLRLQLIKECIATLPRFDVSEIEIKSTVILNTADSLELLKNLYVDKTFAFIMGYDNLEIMASWDKHQELLDNHYIIIASSEIEKTKLIIEYSDKLKKYRDRLILLNTPITAHIRSTIVRQLITEGKDISDFVPEQICKAFSKNNIK